MGPAARAASLSLALAIGLAAPAGARPALRTPGERSRFSHYTTHAEVAAFLAEVARASPLVKVQEVGRTGSAPDFAPAPLFLAVVTREGVDRPDRLDRTKPTILVIASQHGNEQSGKEAALALVRDLAVGDLAPALRRVNVLVMPQVNPYGNATDTRPNEAGLDLNRDHVKLEAPETRAIHAVFRRWMPEVSLDLHEKGDDYYQVNTGCVTNANVAEAIRSFSRRTIFRDTEAEVTRGGSTWHEYLVTEAMGSQGAAGAPERDDPNQAMLTRPSTTDLNDGRNSLGIYETLSFIQEVASHGDDLATLGERTGHAYLGLTALVHSVSAHADEVRRLVQDARRQLLARATAPTASDLVHVRMVHARDPQAPTLTIRAFDTSTAAGGASRPVVTRVIENWFPAVTPTVSVPRPMGYLVPASRRDVVDALRAHGIEVGQVTADRTIDVEEYRVDAVTPSSEDYVAPERIVVSKRAAAVVARRGDFYVSTAQAAANLVPNLLEPQAEFGLIRYRVFALVPEPGAAYPFLRVAVRTALALAPVE